MLIACIAAITIVATTHVVEVGRPPGPQLQIDVPPSWTTSDGGFPAHDYRYVYTALSNAAGRALRVVAVQETIRFGNPVIYPLIGDREVAPIDSLRLFSDTVGYRVESHYDEEAKEAQLDPGTVYVELAVVHGGLPPPGPRIYQTDWSPEVRLATFLSDRPKDWDSAGSVGYHTDFERWGRSWSVLIFARKPFLRADLEAAFAVVASIRFPDSPILLGSQAIEAATQLLPASMRPEPDWLDGCDLRWNYDTVTDSLDNAFRVEFQVLDGTEARSVVRSIAYRVGRDGSVTQLRPERD